MTNPFGSPDWVAISPATATERRTRWQRGFGTRSYSVNGYRGVAVRRTDAGVETERCTHIHKRTAHAVACGEKLARWLNKNAVAS